MTYLHFPFLVKPVSQTIPIIKMLNSLFTESNEQGVVAYAFNSSILEAEPG